MSVKYMRILNVIIACNVLMLIMADAVAQRRGNTQILPVTASPVVDGNLNEWGDELSGVYKAQDLQYELAQDGDHLYLAIRIGDYQRQVQALTRGISLMINTEGRKRDGQAIVFPVVDRISFRSRISGEDGEREEDLRLAALESVRSIRVSMLDRVPDGQIALRNDFGIRGAALVDEEDMLAVEMRMPLVLLGGAEALYGKTVTYNIKIDGVQVPGTGPRPASSVYGRNQYPGPVYGSGRPREEGGIWGQFQLARP